MTIKLNKIFDKEKKNININHKSSIKLASPSDPLIVRSEDEVNFFFCLQ